MNYLQSAASSILPYPRQCLTWAKKEPESAALAVVYATSTLSSSSGNPLMIGLSMASATGLCVAQAIRGLVKYKESQVRNAQSDIILKDIIANSHPKTNKNFFLILPKWDMNGAFALTENHPSNVRFIQTLANTYLIEWVRAGTLDEVTVAMKKVAHISHIALWAHGTSNGFMLSLFGMINGFDLITDDLPNVDENAHWLLFVCQAAKGLGVAPHLSGLFPKGTVFAPTEDSCSKYTTLEIDAEDKPRITQTDGNRVITRVFRS